MVSPLMKHVIAWENAKTALDIAKATEKAARDAVTASYFPEAKTGTHSLPLDDGRVLKCTVGLKVDVDEDKIEGVIGKLRGVGNEGTFIVDRLFSRAWKVSLGELKKIAPQYRKIADKALISKCAAPTIEVVEPKKP